MNALNGEYTSRTPSPLPEKHDSPESLLYQAIASSCDGIDLQQVTYGSGYTYGSTTYDSGIIDRLKKMALAARCHLNERRDPENPAVITLTLSQKGRTGSTLY